jgi:hypothetical protein
VNHVPLEFRRNYDFDPALNFGFEKMRNLPEGLLSISTTELNYIKSIKGRKIYLELEEPNRFLVADKMFNRTLVPDSLFESVLSICPYSTKYFGGLSEVKRQYVFFPTNLAFIPEEKERDFDVVYSGHLHGPAIRNFLMHLQGLKVCVISNSSDPLVTHKGVTHKEKMDLVARAKYSIVHNQLFLNRGHRQNLKRNLPDYAQHGAFSAVKKGRLDHFLDRGITRAPQLKSRLFEAAACGTIPIVIKDEWNLVKDWYGKDEYVESSENDLGALIHDAVANYSKVKKLSGHIREKTARDYSTIAFANRYLSDF